MNAIKKPFLALVIGAVCTPAALAAYNPADYSAAFSDFKTAVQLFKSLPEDAPENQLNDAQNRAFDDLERLGVSSGSLNDVFANADNFSSAADIADWTRGDSIQTEEPDHYTTHSSQKVEAVSNIKGDQVTRAIINKAEHDEGLAHELRFQGIKTAGQLNAAQVLAAHPELHLSRANLLLNAAKQALTDGDSAKHAHFLDMAINEKRAYFAATAPKVNAAPVSSGSRLDMVQGKLGIHIADVQTGTDAAAQAAADKTARFEKFKGDTLVKDNQTRTASQVAALNAAHLTRFKELLADQEAAKESDNITRTASQHVDGAALQARLTEQGQADRDSAQDAAITSAHDRANSAHSLADTVHTQVMVLGQDVDTNTADIAVVKDNVVTALSDIKANTDSITTVKGDVSKLNGEVTAVKGNVTANTGEIAAVKADTAHANTNANIALMNDVKLSGQVSSNITAITNTQHQIAAMGDTATASRYQRMVNARVAAENEAAGMTNTAQEIKISKLAGEVAAVSKPVATVDHTKELKSIHGDIAKTQRTVSDLQTKQAIDSVIYGEQISTLAKETQRQMTSTQRRIADNTTSINKLNSNFSSLKHTVDENKHEAAAGSSSAMAQANIPQVLNGQTVAVGAGVGGYDGESAIAVGVSFRAADSVTVKATVSDDSQQNVGYGAGVSVGW